MFIRLTIKTLEECSAQVDGTVIDTYYRMLGYRSGFFIKFKYLVKGVEYVRDLEVGIEFYDSMSQGKIVAVFYDPSDPNWFYISENP